MKLFQAGFVVKGVDVAGATIHEEENNTLGLAWKLGGALGQWVGRGIVARCGIGDLVKKAFLGEQASEGEFGESSSYVLKEFTAVGAPAEVINLSNKYRQLLKNYNNTLPSIRHSYLEQLTTLTDYCRNNNIDYQLSDHLRQKLDQLKGKISSSERYNLENQIIKNLKIQEILIYSFGHLMFQNLK